MASESQGLDSRHDPFSRCRFAASESRGTLSSRACCRRSSARGGEDARRAPQCAHGRSACAPCGGRGAWDPPRARVFVLYTYCLYELRFSEDEAQRRARAARAAREFPVLFEMLAEGAIHLTGLLLLAPYLTAENHVGLLARARFRTKREIERLIAEIAPRPDVPARIEPLGPRPATSANLWQAFTASLRGPVRELVRGAGVGEAPPAVFDDLAPVVPDDVPSVSDHDLPSVSGDTRRVVFDDTAQSAFVDDRTTPPTDVANDGASEDSPARARVDSHHASLGTMPLAPLRYRVEFTASERYVGLLEEARNLLQHRVPDRDIARVHEIAMAAFVEQLRKRRQAASGSPRVDGAAPARVGAGGDGRRAPARIELATNEDAPLHADPASGRSAPARIALDQPTPQCGRTLGSGARAARRESPAATGRHVPARIRRVIWQRDEGRCTFKDSSGRRCEERAGLEIHHEHAFALGGPATVENLRLSCRAHNGLLAERDFGRERVQRWRERRGRER